MVPTNPGLLPVMRSARQEGPEDINLQVESARVRLALAEWSYKPQPSEHCAAVVQELAELVHLLRVHYEITETWTQANSCLGRTGQIQRELDWLAARRAPVV